MNSEGAICTVPQRKEMSGAAIPYLCNNHAIKKRLSAARGEDPTSANVNGEGGVSLIMTSFLRHDRSRSLTRIPFLLAPHSLEL